jgi:hypothetical protein
MQCAPAKNHARASPSLAQSATTSMDAFSEILSGVKLHGAVFFSAEFSAPWGFSAPAAITYANDLAPGAEHLVLYHLLTNGEAFVQLTNDEPTHLVPGDIVIFPHGDPHRMMSDPSNKTPYPTYGINEKVKARDLTPLIAGGCGEASRFICGYIGQRRHARQDLRSLVRRHPAPLRGRLTRSTDRLARGNTRSYRRQEPWPSARPRRLPLDHRRSRRRSRHLPLLFSRALHQISFRTAHDYLTRWRLKLAARSLEKTARGVAEIAADVGYESEAAFNRAFKREYGLPPGRYRSEHKNAHHTDTRAGSVHSAH